MTNVRRSLTSRHDPVVQKQKSQGLATTGDTSKLSVQKADRIRLEAAAAPQQMDVPGFRFHALKGKDKGRFAVWASENFRITFGWAGEDAIEVDLEDCH